MQRTGKVLDSSDVTRARGRPHRIGNKITPISPGRGPAGNMKTEASNNVRASDKCVSSLDELKLSHEPSEMISSLPQGPPQTLKYVINALYTSN